MKWKQVISDFFIGMVIVSATVIMICLAFLTIFATYAATIKMLGG